MIRTKSLQAKLGQVLRDLRLKAGLSQEQVALSSGITPNHLSRIENGYTNPSLAALAALAETLGVRLHVLIRKAEEQDR